MKRITAYVRVFMAPEVVRELKRQESQRVTALDVSSITEPVWRGEASSGTTSEMHTQMVKLEIVCRDGDVDRLVGVIRDKARTGNPGDGLITVTTVEKCLSIRTGKENEEAL